MCSWDNRIDVLFPIPPAKYNWKPGTLYRKQNKNTLKGGGRQTSWGPQDLRNDMWWVSVSFLFCLLYPSHGAEKAGNLVTRRDTDKNKPTKNLFYLAIEPGKAKADQDRKFLDNYSTPAKHHRKTVTSFALYQQRWSGEANHPSLQGCNKVPKNPFCDGVTGQVGSWNFHFHWSEVRTCPTQCQWKPCGKM